MCCDGFAPFPEDKKRVQGNPHQQMLARAGVPQEEEDL
jgi:hypothetical protein